MRLLLLLLLLLRWLLGPLGDGFLDDRAFGSGVELLVAFFVQLRAHAHVNREPLARVSVIDAAHRGDIAIVAAVGHANVPQAYGLSQRGIEACPAGLREEHFRPGMGGLAADDFFLPGVRPSALSGTR